jgi:hypothetical protein
MCEAIRKLLCCRELLRPYSILVSDVVCFFYLDVNDISASKHWYTPNIIHDWTDIRCTIIPWDLGLSSTHCPTHKPPTSIHPQHDRYNRDIARLCCSQEGVVMHSA